MASLGKREYGISRVRHFSKSPTRKIKKRMIDYKKYTLENGLRLLVHEDSSTPMAVVNLLYDVGARDESPDKTGFAHLFEHLMFGGTKKVPNYDQPIQNAGGECNAFTNSDMTNFYNVVPAENIETAIWLEADRMENLNINKKALETQQKVVVEEFKETCINQPYGDVWHHLADMAYKVHPYNWPTIGKVPEHVEKATLNDVRSFFKKYYLPNNAVLVIAGNVQSDAVFELVTKWFGKIKNGATIERKLPKEPTQTKPIERVNTANVPVDSLYLAFHMPDRQDKDYHAIDLLSDILGSGPSSRLYQRILKEKKMVSSIDCYISGSIDPGLFIIEAKPAEGFTLKMVEKEIWKEIQKLKARKVAKKEFQKIKNKMESTLVFTEMSLTHRAMNLAFYEILEDASLLNQEGERYLAVSNEDIQRVAKKILIKENCCTLHYCKNEA